MKRDMEVVRRLLLVVEQTNAPGIVHIDTTENPFTAASPIYMHWPLLIEAGLIEGEVSSAGSDDTGQNYYLNCNLTWKGHDLVDSIRDPEIWKKTKDGVLAAGGFTVDLLKDLAKGFIKQQIEERTGVKL